MKNVIELKRELQTKYDAQNAIVKATKEESRDLTEDEQTRFDSLQEEIVAKKKELERAEAYEANQAEQAVAIAPATTEASRADEAEKDKIMGRASILRALRAANPLMDDELDGAEKEMHEIGLEEQRNSKVNVDVKRNSISIPLRYLSVNRATQQTVSQDSGEYGGALVQNQAPRMVDPLRPKLAFEELGADFLTGLSGGDLPLVVDNDFAMTFLAEGATITPQKKKYEGPTLSPKRAGGAVDITNRLIMQSSIDVENRVMNGLRNGFAQLLHSACINGAGGNGITGLLSYTGVEASATVAAAAPTWDMIVELQKLIEQNDATDTSLGYLTNPILKAKLKTVKKDAGSGRFLFEGREIDGYKTIITSQVPTLDDGGTDVQPLIYGDFRQMVIGQWGAINIVVDPYSASLADSVRLVMNTHADMQIANPKAFAKNAFINAA